LVCLQTGSLRYEEDGLACQDGSCK
jgi:hypothetical protein